jgi:hypothetical protein
MTSAVFKTDEEIRTPDNKRNHVVILGAGASLAAFPQGDKNGRHLPVIKNFVSVVGLEGLLQSNGFNPPYDDFEGLYSQIASNPTTGRLANEIEQRVYAYFSAMELPTSISLYDHLVLSLRAKDIIATFNWDPFLWQAAVRNAKYAEPPTLLFLHGNVAIGYCPTCKELFPRDRPCRKCGGKTNSSPLLYPVKQKDYNSDPAISAHWKILEEALKSAWTITFFGYGAPKTDVEAVRLLRQGWGTAEERMMEETEIIDIRSESDLTSTWSPFIHSHHYQIHQSFYESSIAKHPRRSCEAVFQRVAMARFVEGTQFPKDFDFHQFRQWLQPRLDAESNI